MTTTSGRRRVAAEDDGGGPSPRAVVELMMFVSARGLFLEPDSMAPNARPTFLREAGRNATPPTEVINVDRASRDAARSMPGATPRG
mmetsp:Transcript_15586/g.35889  ORF Transcript_15586/g.35889 Transcript_15586/m.35889 type:complete len:87 (-) Transcript_15586:105-365(-)